MLSQHSTAVSPQTGFAPDPGLPVRDLLLDDNRMAGILGQPLGLGDVACRRVRTKYRVGESLRVSYELLPRSGPAIRVSLRCFAGGGLDTGAGTATAHRLGRDGTTPDLFLPGLGAAAWVFPNDRRLRSLAAFWQDPESRPRAIGGDSVRLDLMAYAPEKAATIRCSQGDQVIGFAKLYRDGHHRPSTALHRALGRILASFDIGAPEVIAVDDGLDLLVLSPVAGSTLSARNDADDWYLLGRAAARLHTLDPPVALPRFERATLPRLATAAGLIAAARPDVAPILRRLIDALAARNQAIEQGPDVVLHGDLHGKNVLRGERGLAFIDLDQASIGPAAAELGSVIAAMRYDELLSGPAQGEAASTLVASSEVQLLAGYRDAGPLPSVESLDWHIGAALLGERALRAVNRIRVGGLIHLPALLLSALRTVERVER